MITKKIVLVSFIGVFPFLSCKNQTSVFSSISHENTQNKEIVTEIFIEAQTRGFHEKIIVTEKSINHIKQDKQSVKTIDSYTWKKLQELTHEITLSQLNNFKAPTTKRANDADVSTTLQIKTEKEIYHSAIFDKKNPPLEIKKLYDSVYKLIDNH